LAKASKAAARAHHVLADGRAANALPIIRSIQATGATNTRRLPMR
jgi:hypothetical protein